MEDGNARRATARKPVAQLGVRATARERSSRTEGRPKYRRELTLMLLIPLLFMAATGEPATAVPSPRPTVSEPIVSLQTALQVQREGRRLSFTVTVHNPAREPAELRFTDAGLLQITVTAPDGTQIYDSRAGRMFATVMKTVSIEPGKDATFTAAWDAPAGVTGKANVRATVRTTPPLTATAAVELP